MALYFGGGAAFYAGILLTLLGCALLLRFPNRKIGALLRLLVILGMICFVLSSTPIPMACYVLWLALALSTLIALGLKRQPGRRLWRTGAVFGLLLVISLGLIFWETMYAFAPRIEIARDTSIFVIGDSISAGIGAEEATWPQILQTISGYEVTNLAVPAATLRSAQGQAAKINATPCVVFLEIGGNDILGQAAQADFHEHLDKLLSLIADDDRQIVMFELPLPPFHGAFGASQRRLARKYGVTLIPKRKLSAILREGGNTLDGLHLSGKGHNRMARLVHEILMTR